MSDGVPHPDDTFDSDWLSLREPADHRARSEVLVERVATVGVSEGWSRVLDLGSGRGSNLRYLVPRLPWGTRWTAVDHDRALLDEVGRTVEVAVRTVRGDLRSEGLTEIDRHDLVTASALLDLVTREWADAFARRCAAQGVGVLIALTWDGTVRWSEPDPGDDLVTEAVRRHQTGRKGMGVALGPDATEAVADALRANGHEVALEASAWDLAGRRDAALAEELVRGWLTAALEVAPEDRARMEAWARHRIERVRAGDFGLRVGHHDLLALPGGRG